MVGGGEEGRGPLGKIVCLTALEFSFKCMNILMRFYH